MRVFALLEVDHGVYTIETLFFVFQVKKSEFTAEISGPGMMAWFVNGFVIKIRIIEISGYFGMIFIPLVVFPSLVLVIMNFSWIMPVFGLWRIFLDFMKEIVVIRIFRWDF